MELRRAGRGRVGDFADHVFPPAGYGGYSTTPPVLATPFVAEWSARPADVPAEAANLRDELMLSLRTGKAHELVPFTGQTAGLVREVLPAAELVRRLVADTEKHLRAAPSLLG